MFLPNLAPMCPEIITSYADVYSGRQGHGYPMSGDISGVTDTCEGHTGTRKNLTPATDGRAGHVGHCN
ncbi:hypothetical protein ACTACH_09140 [Pseudomonas syringae]|jgi:hypothetical protein|uniref:hypothetical protein n=1 Tax=Pseudomonas syringae TaxID=317 RepID=UPI0008EBA233|nr:hypothetical protein [Pseudomonas syringae]QVK31252.1 hypothetical protein KIJ28_19475 [Pseudomonas syringae]RMM56414.1 hypothetical protein ALQ76_100814 [Pseudomonas syringae pv. atrofaciens]UZS66754.1 hypothetical protein OQB65_20715 [Pseudomonas syringae]SFG79380.1 hypothetical protein SAMN05444062_101445 [Pseudomonas syringae]